MAKLDVEVLRATLVRADAEQVYDALATAEGLNAWFTSGAEVDGRPGGEIVWRWKDWGPDRVTLVARGRVLEARRPERFVFQWWDEGDEAHATTVEISFERVPEGTVVRLREHGFEDSGAGARSLVSNAEGWGEALTLAKFWVEHGLRY